MKPYTYSLQIIQNEEKENTVMTLDSAIEKIRSGQPVTLLEGCPVSVSTPEEEQFYVKPAVNEQFATESCKLILFSAPGATGKSALASYIARTKHALLWDLAKERIANHSLSGMLVEALGIKSFSQFTEGLVNGKAVLIIDALDEADMISGRVAVETLLSDIKNIVKDAQSPTVILCARTETAHMVRSFYEDPEHELPIAQFEISFFEEREAIDFIERKIADRLERKNKEKTAKGKHHTVTEATRNCIKALFDLIRRTAGDPEQTDSFIGYAPVLEALSIFFETSENTMALLKRFERAQDSTEIFVQVMDYILEREHDKAVNGFQTRCKKEFPEFQDWDKVYTIDEQIVRLAYHLVLQSTEYSNYPVSLPEELSVEYAKGMESFLRDHPFVHTFEQRGELYVDFTGPAFRDYILAKLMRLDGYDMFAKEYFSTHNWSSHFPSQLFFDFYAHFLKGTLSGSHFPYVYEAFKSKEIGKTVSSVDIEQVENEEGESIIYLTFSQGTPKRGTTSTMEFAMDPGAELLHISQLSNGYIDIDKPIVLDAAGEDVIICNSSIKCRQLMIRTPNITLSATDGANMLIVCTEAIDTTKSPAAKFDIRTLGGTLQISVPDIEKWFKLRTYSYDFADESNVDFIKFENAVWSILKYFRKHGKDTPGRHREFIKNIIVGNSGLKQSAYCFLEDRKIIYQDHKDLSQIKLSVKHLGKFGINWGDLSQGRSANMHALFDEYKKYVQTQTAAP